MLYTVKQSTSTHTLAILLMMVLGLTGCDAVISSQPDLSQSTITLSKLRHAHLFGSSDGMSKVLNRYEDLVTETEFIVALSEVVLDMNRVLQRYEEEAGVTIKRSFSKSFKGFAMHVDEAEVPHLLDLLDADDDIAWVEPDPKLSLNSSKLGKELDDKQHIPNGVKASGGTKSSTHSGNHNGSVDADLYIIDTGVSNQDINVVEDISFVPGDTGTADVMSHGTHVASTAAAIDDRDGVVGIAPGARVHNLRVLDDNGQAELSTVIAAVEYVTEQKLDNPTTPMVVNISFGADVGTDLYNALDHAIATSISLGIVYVIAAGNEGIDASTVTPAHVSEAITVGAVTEGRKVAIFSNYGSVVDLFAPGESVQGLEAGTLYMEKMDGTSMAAPHVAGAAALYLSHYPSATPQAVCDALIENATKIIGQKPANTTDRRLDVASF